MSIYAILAISDNHVIGKNNKLPWHLPNDLRWFKMNTFNKTIVMGYNTWCSLRKKPLKDRQNIVMTSKYLDDVESFGSFRSLRMRYPTRDLYIIGGATLIQTIAHKIDYWIITHVHTHIDGDCYFRPPYKKLKTIYESPHYKPKDKKYSYHHAIYKYKRSR